MNLEQTEFISKTTLKKEAKQIQSLGVEISKFNPEVIEDFNFPLNIVNAIIDLKNIKSNSAKKRQAQYLGKLLRTIDLTETYNLIAKLKMNSKKELQINSLVEEWRDKLIRDESELTNLINLYPNIDIQATRKIILNSQKEKGKSNKYCKQLYQSLRSFIL
jgi:ribosome-associated protein